MSMHALLLVMALMSGPPEVKVDPYAKFTQDKVIQRMLWDANWYRKQSGRQPLVLDGNMCKHAMSHANWMGSYGMQHSNLPWMEGVGAGVSTPQAAVWMWRRSWAHNNLMMSGTRVGFGYKYVNGYPYWIFVTR